MLKTPLCSAGPSFSTPTSWSRKEEHVQLSYELQHRVNFAEFYPVRASNGSRVMVYGHDRGLTCLWRGGTPFASDPKPASILKASSTSNANSQDDVIMIDDDDNDEATNTLGDGGHNYFGHSRGNSRTSPEDTEVDSAHPFDSIIHSLDITLNTSVNHISFAALPPALNSFPDADIPQIFYKNLVLAVACANGSIHVITVPLIPSTATDSGVRDLLIVEQSQSTRYLPRGISQTWTSALSLPLSSAYPTLYRQKGNSNATLSAIPPASSILVAYHTPKKSGMLTVLEVPLDASGNALVPEMVNQLREVNLPNPAKFISFNPAPYPSGLHTQILVADSLGVARIYEPVLRPPAQAALTDDFTADQLSDAWLASLYAPFEHVKGSSQSSFRRERRSEILDAKWVFDGQAVIVLLADGQWGIWDLSGVGPGQNRNLLSGNPGVSGNRISGGGVTRFALRGYIGHTTSIRAPSIGHKGPEPAVQTGGAKLAPMTPNTRKAKQEALFNSTKPRPNPVQTRSAGGISLSRLAPNPSHDTHDESLFMWFNSEVYYAPSLMSYWQQAAHSIAAGNKHKGEDNAGTLFGPNLATFQNLSTEGEMITTISQAAQQDSLATKAAQPIYSDILLSAEHRLLLFCPLKHQDQTVALTELFTTPSKHPVGDLSLRRRLDQEMLSRGDLDLGAMDKMLDTMDRPMTGTNGPRRVEFSLDI